MSKYEYFYGPYSTIQRKEASDYNAHFRDKVDAITLRSLLQSDPPLKEAPQRELPKEIAV
jgi:hypothetical protein